jgi:hypothetical protein
MSQINYAQEQQYYKVQKSDVSVDHLRGAKEATNRQTQATYEIPENLDIFRCTPKFENSRSYAIIGSADSNGSMTSYWVLPIPTSLTYDSDYSWSSEGLDHGAAAVASLGNAIAKASSGDWAGGLKIAGESITGGVVDAIPTYLMRSGVQKFASALGVNGEQVLRQAEKANGIAYNPNKQLYFNEVDMRDFSVTFSLAPTSKTEAENIQKGFSNLAYHAAPDYSPEQFYFTYPDFFKFAVVVCDNGGSHHVMYSRAGLAITQLNLDLSPDSALTWHDDGFPTALQLQVTFKESIVPTRENLSKITLFGKPITKVALPR